MYARPLLKMKSISHSLINYKFQLFFFEIHNMQPNLSVVTFHRKKS